MWQRFFDVNVTSGIRLSRAYAAGMAERGWDRVVFISSESAINAPPEMMHHGMTKTSDSHRRSAGWIPPLCEV